MRIIGFALRGRRLAALLGLTGAAVLGLGASSASAAPLFTQCPPIGADTGCGVLITVNPDGTGSVASDPSQPPYENVEDTLVGLQNNSTGTVNSVDLSSPGPPPVDIFGFDGDGICDSSISPQPAGCPFGTTGYEGPGTSFSNINQTDFSSGTVNFSPAVGPGGSAYWSLEEAISAADINLGTIAVTPAAGAVQGATCGSVSLSAVGYKPKKSLTPTVPGVRAYVKVDTPSQVQVQASIVPLGGSSAAAKATNLGTFSFHDSGSKKLRIALPKRLLAEFKLGDRVRLNLAVTTTPDSAAQCGGTSKQVSLKTRIVHVLKSEAQ